MPIFCTINIASFQDPQVFKARLKQMADDVRAEPALDPSRPVMVPGDPEKKAWKKRSQKGVPVPGHVWGEIGDEDDQL